METVEGYKAIAPISHFYFSEAVNKQIVVEADCLEEAWQKASQSAPWHRTNSLTYVQSIDAAGRFVYSF